MHPVVYRTLKEAFSDVWTTVAIVMIAVAIVGFGISIVSALKGK